ncbi:hypothetical protein B0H11DRAFT_913596 [Mycena galericulata]|nr:hypothetical protein B0H11DRAFT_913596 [Mycena galericulata]
MSHSGTQVAVASTSSLGQYDDTGAVVVAGHPHFPSLIKVATYSTSAAVSPSWVVAITDTKVETIFQSDGSILSSSSTGLRDSAGALYVTGLYADSLLICGA